MTKDEWIAYYNKKTPEPFKPDERMNFFFHPDKGFCEVGMSDNCVFIGQLAGDGRWWKEKVDAMARVFGCKRGSCFFCRRSVPAYLRLFGYKVEGREMIGEYTKYVCSNKDSGKYLFAFPTGHFLHGIQLYYMEWEV